VHRSVFKGPHGLLKWGYLSAATLGPWTLTAETAGDTVRHSLSATVRSQDAYAVSQQPLAFVVPRPSGVWRWPVESLQIVDGALTAALGPQET
jgi:hypothetical protein